MTKTLENDWKKETVKDLRAWECNKLADLLLETED